MSMAPSAQAAASLKPVVGLFLFSWVALVSVLATTDAAVDVVALVLSSDWRVLGAVAIAFGVLVGAIAASLVGIVAWSLLYSRWLSPDERVRLFRGVFPDGSFSGLGQSALCYFCKGIKA